MSWSDSDYECDFSYYHSQNGNTMLAYNQYFSELNDDAFEEILDRVKRSTIVRGIDINGISLICLSIQ